MRRWVARGSRQTAMVTSTADDRLLAPYRAVRRVSAGDDGPWSGLLVRLESGESRVLVDAHGFEPGWAGWTAPADGHVLAPLDVVRRSDGHDLMLPMCVERVADFLARRATGRVPLTAGETVTLGVSLVRGFGACDGGGTGEWWLTDAGRPVFAAGASARDGAAHTVELLATLIDGSACAGAVAAAVDVLRGDRVTARDLRDAEDALFALAPPEPLATSLLGSRAAREVVAYDRAPIAALDDAARSRTWVDALARQVDADLADAFSQATTGLWRRLRTPRPGARRPWLLATAAAAVVLVAGLLWPTGADGPATADAGSERVAGSATVAPSASADPAADSAAPDTAVAAPADLVAVTDRLLIARTACAGDTSCLGDVLVDPASVFPPGAIDLEPTLRTTTLLDDFGGVAVLRVDATETAVDAQLVVIIRHDDRWLLRDVHAVQQP